MVEHFTCNEDVAGSIPASGSQSRRSLPALLSCKPKKALRSARFDVEATRAGLFVPLGHGAAPVAQTLQALNEHRYDGWLVLEQDTAITADEPAVTSAPMLAVRQSIAFLNSAHTTEEINR